MASETHTPGPWTVNEDDMSIMADVGAHIAQVSDAHDFVCLEDHEQLQIEDQCMANALLIAAAPDLFEAALAAKDFLIDDLEEPGRTVFWKLIAALKKAGWNAPDNAARATRPSTRSGD